MKASSLGGPKPQFVDANGNPYSGAKLFFYAAGSSTKQNTYRDSSGATPNSNPIVLDSSGRPTYEIWFTDGLTYKAVLAPSTDSDPPNSPIFTIDNLPGINDVTATVDEWTASGLTPTYVGATSFTVSGDQTATFTAGRRLKSANTAGTIYSTVSTSSYSGGTLLTTVTVINDSGTLDSGLSSVSLSILRADNPSLPAVRYYHADGTAALPSVTFVNDKDCGWYRIGANNLGLALNGSKAADYAAGLIKHLIPLSVDQGGIGFSLNANQAFGAKNTDDTVEVGGFWSNTSTGNNKFLAFGTEPGYAERGGIDYNRAGSAVRYNTTSDGRLKIKNGPAQYDPQWIHNVAASIFDVTWKETGYRIDTFVAQDLYQAEPDAVKVGDNAPEIVDGASIWGVDPSKLVAKLILEVAELRRRLDSM